MRTVEKFINWSGSNLPPSFLATLDRMFGYAMSETGPFATAVRTFSFSPNDTIDSLQVDATAAATTVYLPPPNGNRRRRVIKTDASANAVTVNGNGYNINGATTYALAAQYNKVTVEPTGNGWLIVG